MAATTRQPGPDSLAKAGLVTRRDNVITVADSALKASIDVAAYVAAIVLAGAAAFFSIKATVRATGVAVAGVIASVLVAVPSISYAGRPIGIGAALVMRAAGPQLIGAISAAAGGWWLQTTVLTECSSLVRILLSTGFCACIYLIIVVGLFRITEPIKVAARVVQGQLWRNR